jgi:hypothetical protein
MLRSLMRDPFRYTSENNLHSSNSNNKNHALRRPVCSYPLLPSHLPAVLPLRALSTSSTGNISISSSLSKLGRGCCERQYKTMPNVQQAAKTHGTTIAAAKAGRYRSVLSLARVFVLLADAALVVLVVSGTLEMLDISVVAELVSGCGVMAGSVIFFCIAEVWYRTGHSFHCCHWNFVGPYNHARDKLICCDCCGGLVWAA